MNVKWTVRILVWGCLLAGAAGAAGAESPQALFERGNACYRSGDFPAAELAYRQLLDQGVASGSVHYNLGNACFKQKKLGEAIYHWEKARRQLPGDAEVRENLQYANLLVVDRIEVPEDPVAVALLSRAVHWFTVDQETRIALGLFLAANFLFALALLTPGRRIASWGLAASLTAVLLALVFAGSLGWKLFEQTHRRQGVIVEQKVDVRSGPGGENVAVVAIHEGVVVRVRGETADWLQISLPNGWTGWIPSRAARIL